MKFDVVLDSTNGQILNRIHRKAVRAVIFSNDKLLMIRTKRGDFKLPGGGVNKNEDEQPALIREVNEETGYGNCLVHEFIGRVLQSNIDKYDPEMIFEMESKYYLCSVEGDMKNQHLDVYETDLEFTPVWISIEEAIVLNAFYIHTNPDDPSWVVRENIILKKLQELYGKNTAQSVVYPKSLSKGDTIGICAPSSGVTGVFEKRLDAAIHKLELLGYNVTETESVRRQFKSSSASPKQRAEEFMTLYTDPKVKVILPPWGGEFLIEMLSLLDFDTLKKLPPKWILGFSDISALLFALTVNCKIATAHGPNALDFGADPVHETVLNSLHLLSSSKPHTGLKRNLELESSPKEATDNSVPASYLQYSTQTYQSEWGDVFENVTVPYNLNEITQWKNLDTNSKRTAFSGYLLGGCLDVLCKLTGTPYDTVSDFVGSKTAGVIWYFESCAMNAADIHITLCQLHLCGWFENCSGVLIGRPDGYTDKEDFTLIDALTSLQYKLKVPILYDLDIGHIPPQLTLVNGAYAHVTYENSKGSIIQAFI